MARKAKGQGFEDVSSYSVQEKKKRRKGQRGRVVLQSIAAVVCVVLILFGSVLVYISTDLIGELTTGAITKDPEKLGINDNKLPGVAVSDSSIKNIAVFGLDARNDQFVGRSDLLMVVTVDNRHGSIKMSSILRDSQVHIEGEGFGAHYDEYTKINAAYAWGGPELAVRTLNRNFGLRIEDYVTINFVNMAAIVDAFGGVEVDVSAGEIEEIYTNLSNLSREVESQKNIDMAEGVYDDRKYPEISDGDYMSATAEMATYLLNGNQAVAYGRIRYIGDDFGRVERQQKVLVGLIQRVKLLSVTDYPQLVKKLMPYCLTNLELDDILGILPILTKDIEIESISVPDVDYDLIEDMRSDIVYDIESAAKRMSAFIYEEQSPYWNEYNGSSAAGEDGESEEGE